MEMLPHCRVLNGCQQHAAQRPFDDFILLDVYCCRLPLVCNLNITLSPVTQIKSLVCIEARRALREIDVSECCHFYDLSCHQQIYAAQTKTVCLFACVEFIYLVSFLLCGL